MAGILDLLRASLDDDSVQSISSKLGQDSKLTGKAIEAALPMLLGAMNRNSQEDNGSGISRALDSGHDGSILGNLSGFLSGGDESDGNGILRHVLGDRRNVAEQALQSASGIGSEQASSLLATLAPIVMGAIGKAKSDQGMGAADIAGMLAGEAKEIEHRSPGIMGAVSGLLDADGDGDTDLADLLKHGSSGIGRLFR